MPKGRWKSFARILTPRRMKKFSRRMWRFREIHRRFGWKFWAVISGGATLDPETERFWGRTGFAAIQGYGLTETTSLVSVNHPFRIGRGSIGKVLQGREVKLDENGEILVRGENIAAGYWEDGETHRGHEERRRRGMVSHGRSGRARRRWESLFQGAQEKRHRHGRGDERLSRRPGSFVAARTGSEGLRGGGARTRRERRALRRPAVARRNAGETAAPRRGDCRARERIPGGISADALVVPVARGGFSAHVHGQTETRRDSRAVEAQWGNGDGAANWPATNGGIGELIARMQGGARAKSIRTQISKAICT